MKDISHLKYFDKIAFGITNETEDHYFIPFFDFDTPDLNIVIKELTIIQSMAHLSNIYIIKSTNGFNAFSLDKLAFDILKIIYDYTTKVDRDFIRCGLNRGHMTLRVGDDKHLIHICRTNLGCYQKSNGHKIFFREIMDIPIADNDNFDDRQQFTICKFENNKYGIEKKILKKVDE